MPENRLSSSLKGITNSPPSPSISSLSNHLSSSLTSIREVEFEVEAETTLDDTRKFKGESKKVSISQVGEKATDLKISTLISGRTIPPPITCLRCVKNGKPYSYMRINEEDGSHVVEEIKIPPGGDILVASRDGGSLKLYPAWVEDEEEGDDEDIEEEGEGEVEDEASYC